MMTTDINLFLSTMMMTQMTIHPLLMLTPITIPIRRSLGSPTHRGGQCTVVIYCSHLNIHNYRQLRPKSITQVSP